MRSMQGSFLFLEQQWLTQNWLKKVMAAINNTFKAVSIWQYLIRNRFQLLGKYHK